VVGQIAERQTAVLVQGPSPVMYPHLLSVSQTPLRQARAPFALVQTPLMGEVAGSDWPFATFGEQEPLAHHWLVGQSVSTAQTEPQAPVEGLQMAPVWVPTQSVFALHRPQDPAVAQYGSLLVGHARLPPDPSSPLHGAHVSVAVLHTGALALQATLLVPVHMTHVDVDTAQAGVAPEQSPSLAHCSQVPRRGPLVAQMRERHRVASVAVVHGPSPMAYPQLPSGSHAFERQTPALLLQGPSPFRYPQARSVGSHAPLRQTVPPFATEQVPSPFAYPQRLSESQTPL
jgi:hypothetical protein